MWQIRDVMNKNLMYLFCFCMIFSCKSGMDTDSANEIYPLKSTVVVDDVSSYISELELIPVADVSIGNISKLIQHDSTMFALSGGVVFRISSDGKAVTRIGNVGRGPGEYLMIKDFSFNLAEDELWCLDVVGKLLKYRVEDDGYIETIDVGTEIGYCNAFIPMRDNGFALYIPNPSESPLRENLNHDCIRVYDEDGQFLESGLPWRGFNVVSSFSIPVSYSGNRTYVLSPESSLPSIVYVDGKESETVYFDFEKRSLPLDYAFHYKPDPWASIGDIFEKDYYKVVSCVYCLNDAKYFHAYGKESSSWNFYVSNAGSGFRWCSKGLLAPPISAIGCHEDYLYFSFADYGLTEYDQEIDPLKKAVLERFGNRSEEGYSYLIKVKFNVL